MPGDQPVRVSLPRAVWVVVALVVALLTAIFVAQIVLLTDQLGNIRTQRSIAERQARHALPVLRETRALLRDARRGAPEAGRIVRGVDALAREATPLARDLRDARLGESVQRAGTLAAVLLEADVGSATRAGRELAETVLRADAPRALRDLSAVSSELLEKDRLRRVLVRTLRLSGEAIEQDLVRKGARAADATTDTAALMRRLLAVQEEALALARETERHAESIDRKTGGPAAAPPVPAAP
jgi:hypothetical protein